MVLLSCSGTGGGIYAKLANGVAQYNFAQGSPPDEAVLLAIVSKRVLSAT
jgi:hypothetical protein